jgi:hypothetical protein
MPLLFSTFAALFLATACEDTSKLRDAETFSNVVDSVPADPRLLPTLAGRWRMVAKQTDALVPNITFVLRPDGGLDFYRDDGGGTNFSSRFFGTWAVSSPGPGRFVITFEFTDAEPRRRCLALPGECSEYKLPFRETWSFTEPRPGMIETPGAVWWRSELLPGETATGSARGRAASNGSEALVAPEPGVVP